ncbi:TIGR01841 family phasin [Paraburkholderia sp. J41]|uniref:TIGR01841 family phasin n=1 Tax=Paraburkholderia sp. J41 TaxID=2805433 RepID=UPI002AC31A5D|nr:TIGR01841 family phasin [Paraburkholderia sp. J41]
MFVSAPESFRANYQAGIAAFFALAQPALEGAQAVFDLNLQTGKAALSESEAALKNALQSGSPAEFVTQQIGASQHAAAKAMSYGRQLADIASHTQQAWVEAAQAHAGEQGQRVKALSEGFASFTPPFMAPFASQFASQFAAPFVPFAQFGQPAPVGAEAFIAAMNSSIAAFGHAAETLRGITRQAVETAQGGFQHAVAPAQEATQAAAKAGTAKV